MSDRDTMIALLAASSKVRDGGWINGAPSHILAELLMALEDDGWQLCRIPHADDQELDWQQKRIQAAASVLRGLTSADFVLATPEDVAEEALRAADMAAATELETTITSLAETHNTIVAENDRLRIALEQIRSSEYMSDDSFYRACDIARRALEESS